MTASFRWLHLTDFHLGMKRHGAHWPVLETAFFEDIIRIQNGHTPIQAVIFTGDLVNLGSAEEFDQLELWLKKLWAKLNDIGSTPVLVVVPGNHDLVRPPTKSAAQQCLTKMWRDKDIQDSFWNDSTSDTRKLVTSAFQAYTHWWNNTSIPKPKKIDHGVLPGDFSTTIEVGEFRVGLVGLNTAFLHLADVIPGNLAISIEQLNGLCDNHAPEWHRKHDASILVTHHPLSWLDNESKQFYEGDLYVPSHFSVHLFGHMHVADQATWSNNGAGARTIFQGDSLFGLDRTAMGESRSHGYCIGEITLGASTSLRFFPRAAVKKGNGSWAFDRHTKFIINDDNSTDPIALPARAERAEEIKPIDDQPVDQRLSFESISAQSNIEIANNLALTRAIFRLSPSNRHVNVRGAEQEEFAANLKLKRATWICADWGMGANGFIWSALVRDKELLNNIFLLSLAEYKTLPEFLNDIKAVLGCSFQHFCKALAAIGQAYLILDEVPSAFNDANSAIEQDLEQLSDMVLTFCPNLSIILRTRQAPKIHSFPITFLKPLDEAETRSYIISEANGSQDLTSKDAVREIYRHTGGIPDQIDETIDSLKFISIGELGSLSLEFSPVELSKSAAPRSLIEAVDELKNSSDVTLRRAHGLLLALAILPYGETIERIKRFSRDEPYFPLHATELFKRGLIEVVTLSSTLSTKGSSTSGVRLLMAPKPVRDFILGQLSKVEVNLLNREAASLYFGEKWTTSTPKIISFGDTYSTTDEDSILNNINIIIQRLIIDFLSISSKSLIEKILVIAISFAAKLREQKQYLTCVSSTSDFLRILPNNSYTQQRDMLNVLRGLSLRMLGHIAEAKDAFLRLSESNVDKATRARIQLNLAMCYQTLGDPAALVVAKELIKSAAGTNVVYPAKALLLEIMDKDSPQASKMKRLEREARKNNAATTANNIILYLSNKYEDSYEATKSALQRVADSASSDRDVYTRSRAVIRIGTLSDTEGVLLKDAEIRQLIDAYHYVYNQRFDNLFNLAHDAIWNYFEKIVDIENLLKLFRHSSFIWRLHSQEEREKPFIHRLIRLRPSLPKDSQTQASSEVAYFKTRQKAQSAEPDDVLNSDSHAEQAD